MTIYGPLTRGTTSARGAGNSEPSGEMFVSYLNPLRLHFSGSFEAAVSTVNDDPVHYDSARFKPSYAEPQSGTTPDELNGWFNPDGSGDWKLHSCAVTAARALRRRAASPPRGRLSVKFNVDGFSMTPGARFMMGRIVGTIGPAGPEEPRHVVAGRQLMAAAGPGAARSLGVLPASLYTDPAWYPATAGIVAFLPGRPLTDDELAAVEAGPLSLVATTAGGPPKVVIGEPADGLFVRADQFVFRLDPGEAAVADLYAPRFGRPHAGAAVITVPVPGQLQPDSPLAPGQAPPVARPSA